MMKKKKKQQSKTLRIKKRKNMKRTIKRAGIITLILMVFCWNVNAVILNGDFSDGINNWSCSGYESYSGNNYSCYAAGGQGVAHAFADATGSGDPWTHAYLSQTIDTDNYNYLNFSCSCTESSSGVLGYGTCRIKIGSSYQPTISTSGITYFHVDISAVNSTTIKLHSESHSDEWDDYTVNTYCDNFILDTLMNTAPTISIPTPSNNSNIFTGSGVDIIFNVYDLDADLLNVDVIKFHDDGSNTSCNYFAKSSGSQISCTWTENFIAGQVYNWTVSISDGTDSYYGRYFFNYGDTVNWTITIKDFQNWNPIQNATIYIQSDTTSANYTLDTNLSGSAFFQVGEGLHYVTISKNNYWTVFKTSTLNLLTSQWDTYYLDSANFNNSITFIVSHWENLVRADNVQIMYYNTIEPLIQYEANTSSNGEITLNNTAPIGESIYFKVFKEGYVNPAVSSGWCVFVAEVQNEALYLMIMQENLSEFNISFHIKDSVISANIEGVLIEAINEDTFESSFCYTDLYGNCSMNVIGHENFNMHLNKVGYNPKIVTEYIYQNETFCYNITKATELCAVVIESYEIFEGNDFLLDFVNFNITYEVGNLSEIVLSGTTDENGHYGSSIVCNSNLKINANKLYFSTDIFNFNVNAGEITHINTHHTRTSYTVPVHGFVLNGNYSLYANATKYGELGVKICAYDSDNLIECTTTSFIVEDGILKNGYFIFNEIGVDKNINFKWSKNTFKDGSEIVYVDIMTNQNPIYFTIHEGGLTDFINSLSDGFTREHFYLFMRYFGWWMIILLLIKIFWEAMKGDKKGGEIQTTRTFGNSGSRWGLN